MEAVSQRGIERKRNEFDSRERKKQIYGCLIFQGISRKNMHRNSMRVQHLRSARTIFRQIVGYFMVLQNGISISLIYL